RCVARTGPVMLMDCLVQSGLAVVLKGWATPTARPVSSSRWEITAVEQGSAPPKGEDQIYIGEGDQLVNTQTELKPALPSSFWVYIYISRSLPLSFVYVHLCPSVTSSSLSSLSSLSAQCGMQPPSEQDLLLLLRGGPAAGGGRSEQPKRPAPAEVVDLSSSPAVPATAAEQPDPKRPKPAPSAVRNSPPLSSCMILTPLVAR